MGWPTREQEFSQISDDALDIVVRNVLSLSPNSGIRTVTTNSSDGGLSYMGLFMDSQE